METHPMFISETTHRPAVIPLVALMDRSTVSISH